MGRIIPDIYIYIYIFEGSLEVKLPTVWTDEKQRWKGSERRERVEERRAEDPGARKGRKVAKHCVFQWFVAPGRKVGSLKRRVRSQLARWEMNNCTPLWREAHFEVKMYKTPQPRTAFGSWDVEKVHAVVARSTFPSQNVQNTPCSDHFWKLRCRKSARRCGAKHISYITRRYTPLRYNYNYTTTLHYTPLHSTKLHYTTLHYTTLHSTTLHYTTLPSATLHYITLHYTTLQLQLHNYTPLHSTTLNYTTLNCTTLHYITLHYIPLHSIHYTTLHYTTLYWMTLRHR